LKPKNLRRSPRVSVSFPVEYTAGNMTCRLRAGTLSGGGLFLTGPQELAPGTEIALRFRPARHLPLIEAKARVCYQVPGRGAAVAFEEISAEHRHLLLRLIHHKTGNKRAFPRAPLATQIECEECMSLAFSRDVSLGGMFIETTRPMPVGSRLSLRFNLDDNGPIIVAAAEVAYQVVKLGMAVQFVELAPEDRQRLEAYVARAEAPATAAA
jgi:hypothetical protein